MTDAPPSRAPRRWMWLLLAGVGLCLVGILVVASPAGRVLNEMLIYAPGIDKPLHVAASFLMLLALDAVARRVLRSRAVAMAAAVLATAIFAVASEFGQIGVPNRSVEAGDVVAAGGGIALGLSVLTRRRPASALVLGLLGLAIGGGVTYRSYEETKDIKAALRLVSQGRYKEARAAYRRVLARGISSANVYNGVAWTEIESGEGDPAFAVDYAERSLALAPGDPDALDTYGWALYHAGRTDEAYARLMEAYEKRPSIYCIHYHLGMVVWKQGRLPEAARHLRLQIEQAPRSREADLARAALQTHPELVAAEQGRVP